MTCPKVLQVTPIR